MWLRILPRTAQASIHLYGSYGSVAGAGRRPLLAESGQSHGGDQATIEPKAIYEIRGGQ